MRESAKREEAHKKEIAELKLLREKHELVCELVLRKLSDKVELWQEFKKTKEGKDATVIDYKAAAAEIRDQIRCLMADTKSVRAHLPKQAPANKK